MDNEMYPNDGEYFLPTEPEGQIQERKQERSKTAAALPLIKDLISRLEKRIAYYESFNSIDNDKLTKPTEFMNQVKANKQTRENLIQELEYLTQLKDQHS